MISEQLRAKIRRLYFAEHWKAGTIAAELGVHRDTVLLAIEARSFLSETSRVRAEMLVKGSKHLVSCFVNAFPDQAAKDWEVCKSLTTL